jgi:hypothetical protein
MPDEFEDVEVPQGTFIGWGKIGQTIRGRVITYSATGGRSFNGDDCPQVVLELTLDATNYKDKGTTEENLSSGELVTITAGQANLSRALEAANPAKGDELRIKFDDTYKTAQGTGKSFKVQIARNVPSVSADELV